MWGAPSALLPRGKTHAPKDISPSYPSLIHFLGGPLCSSISPDPLTARQRCQQRGVRSVLQRPALRCNARLRGGSGVRPIERLARRSKGGAVGLAAFKRSSNNNCNKQQRQQRWRPESLRRHATWDEGEQRGLGGGGKGVKPKASGPEGTSRPAGRRGLCGWGRGAEIVHKLYRQMPTCGARVCACDIAYVLTGKQGVTGPTRATC